jgi:hypothetical protein
MDENDNDDNNIEQEVSFVLSPSIIQFLEHMLGAEDESVSISKAVKLNVI